MRLQNRRDAKNKQEPGDRNAAWGQNLQLLPKISLRSKSCISQATLTMLNNDMYQNVPHNYVECVHNHTAIFHDPDDPLQSYL